VLILVTWSRAPVEQQGAGIVSNRVGSPELTFHSVSDHYAVVTEENTHNLNLERREWTSGILACTVDRQVDPL
jgi:hypothetical protein